VAISMARNFLTIYDGAATSCHAVLDRDLLINARSSRDIESKKHRPDGGTLTPAAFQGRAAILK
jgi:hypothetical protein